MSKYTAIKQVITRLRDDFSNINNIDEATSSAISLSFQDVITSLDHENNSSPKDRLNKLKGEINSIRNNKLESYITILDKCLEMLEPNFDLSEKKQLPSTISTNERTPLSSSPSSSGSSSTYYSNSDSNNDLFFDYLILDTYLHNNCSTPCSVNNNPHGLFNSCNSSDGLSNSKSSDSPCSESKRSDSKSLDSSKSDSKSSDSSKSDSKSSDGCNSNSSDGSDDSNCADSGGSDFSC